MDLELVLNIIFYCIWFFSSFIIFLVILNFQLKKEVINKCKTRDNYKLLLKEENDYQKIILKKINIIQIVISVATLISSGILFSSFIKFAVCFLALFIPEVCQGSFILLPVMTIVFISLLSILVCIILGKRLYLKYKIKDRLALDA